MLSVRRWSAVAGGVAVLVALPAAIAAWPVSQSKISAPDLLARIRGSESVPYSGYAESFGGLSLPVTRQFSTVTDLFGQTTQMRAWFRGAKDWRVDTLTVAGETDVHAGPTGTWSWSFEDNRATWSAGAVDPAVRLPTAADLLPTNLARRLLSEATPGQVHRLGNRRIAGRSAPGLELVPNVVGSTIERVDVWADQRTGLPLRVDVYGDGTNVMSSRFLDFSTGRPSAHDTAFSPPPTARVQMLGEPDIAAEIDQFGDATAPVVLAGVPRNPQLPAFGAIGVYGSGVTEFAAAPLPGRTAFSLQRQLKGTAVKTKYGQLVAIGPLSLLLTDPDRPGRTWLLTGTVTSDLLNAAAAQLVGPP